MDKTLNILKNYDESNAWGLYTAIDLKNCNIDYIRSKSKINSFIEQLCLHIGMIKYGAPQIINFGRDSKISGYSMTQFIESSLISGHFVNETNSAFIDIFSCKKYDPEKAGIFCSNFFEADSFNIHTILRK